MKQTITKIIYNLVIVNGYFISTKSKDLNEKHVLKKEWEPEEASQSKLRKVLQDINIDEFEDFMADILGLCESFEEMVYEFEGNINLSPEYLERVYPEEKESLEKLKNQIKEHKEWKEKHQASYSFLTRKLLEKNESDNNEKNT